MKAKYLMIALIGLGMTACGKQSQTSETVSGDDTTTVVAVEPQPDSAVAEEIPAEETTEEAIPAEEESSSEADIEMLKQFYAKCVFGSSSPKKYCTQKCLKKLAAANEYDDGGYAVWKFRTENQDGDGPSKVTDVTPDGDGWYTVSYRDMGAKGVTKVLVVDGKIDDYKRVS